MTSPTDLVAENCIQTLPDTPGSTYTEDLPSPNYSEGTTVRGEGRPALETSFDRPSNESRGHSTLSNVITRALFGKKHVEKQRSRRVWQ